MASQFSQGHAKIGMCDYVCYNHFYFISLTISRNVGFQRRVSAFLGNNIRCLMSFLDFFDDYCPPFVTMEFSLTKVESGHADS